LNTTEQKSSFLIACDSIELFISKVTLKSKAKNKEFFKGTTFITSQSRCVESQVI